jgi:hypothetical protein
VNIFQKLEATIASWFGSHGAKIKAAIEDAITVVNDASAVATAAGETKVVPVLSTISDGLIKTQAAVTAEMSATTLTTQAGALSTLASGLIQQTNDVGIKDTATKAKVGTVLTKVGNVVGALQSALDSQAPTS